MQFLQWAKQTTKRFLMFSNKRFPVTHSKFKKLHNDYEKKLIECYLNKNVVKIAKLERGRCDAEKWQVCPTCSLITKKYLFNDPFITEHGIGYEKIATPAKGATLICKECESELKTEE